MSAKSLRKHDPEAHITLLADKSWDSNVFDKIMVEDLIGYELVHDRCYENKMYNLNRTPYEKTFLVDADTYFLANCRGLFELLDWYDVCLTSSNAYLPIMGPVAPHARVEGFIPCNSGVMLYKDSTSTYNAFFEMKYLYQEMRGTYRTRRMDIYLTTALARGNVKVYTLPPIFNVRIGSKACLHGPAKILHSAGKAPLNEEEWEAVAKKINVDTEGRFWDGKEGRLV